MTLCCVIISSPFKTFSTTFYFNLDSKIRSADIEFCLRKKQLKNKQNHKHKNMIIL